MIPNIHATVTRRSGYDVGMAEEKKRRFGPVPGPPTRQYTLMLEEESAEWGKRQPGGLSELVRRLLKEEQKRQKKDIEQ